MTTRVGMLGAPSGLLVGPHGAIREADGRAVLRVWVGAEDGWHNPAEQTSTRQRRVGAAPVVETSIRTGTGDVRATVFGTYMHPDVYCVDVTNDGTAPVVVAFVTDRLRSVVAGSPEDRPDDAASHVLVPRPPRDLVDAGSVEGVWARLTAAATPLQNGDGVTVSDLTRTMGELDAGSAHAVVYPLPHGATIRVAIRNGQGTLPDGGLAALPDVAKVEAGWQSMLRRGMSTVLPDARLQQAVDASRVELLLAHAHVPATPDMMIALEDWGFDDEAQEAFLQLSFLDRRRVTHRAVDAAPWGRIDQLLRTMTPTCTFPDGPERYLNHVRSLLAFERPDHTVDLLTYLPPGWHGQSLDVTNCPTRGGRVSYAIRWHDARPAILWECEQPGLRLRVPGLDPIWMTEDQSGEALLNPVPR